MAEDHDLRDGLGRVADTVTPESATAVVEGARRHRARRRRRRRLAVTGLSALTIFALVGAAIALPRLGDDDDGRGVTADAHAGPVTLPRLPNHIVDLAGDDEGVWVLTATDLRVDEPIGAVVVRLDLDGEVTATGAVAGPVDRLVVSEDGVWVTGRQVDALTRLDRDSLSVTATIDLAFAPEDLTIAGGRPWLSSPTELVAVDPTTNAIDVRVEQRARGIGGDDDTLFVAHRDRLGRIDPTTGADLASLPVQDGTFTSFDVTSSGGFLWITADSPVTNPSSATLVVDPHTGDVLEGLPGGAEATGDDEPWYVVATPDGSGELHRGFGRPTGADTTYGPADPYRPATEAGGDYWWADGPGRVTRVPADHSAPTATDVVRDPRDEIGPTDADGCTTPPPGFDGGEAFIETLSPEERDAVAEGLDPGQRDLHDQIVENAAADRTQVAVPAGTPDGFISNRTMQLASGALGPVVDRDNCLIGWWSGGFLSRDVAEAPDFDPTTVASDTGTSGPITGGAVMGQLDPDDEQRLVRIDDPTLPGGFRRFRVDPSGFGFVHNDEFANCLELGDEELCDPHIDDHELRVRQVQGNDTLVVAALLPDGVETVVLETDGDDLWQQTDFGFAVFAVGGVGPHPSLERLVGYDADGDEVFAEPLD
jgi:hypothetical protein